MKKKKDIKNSENNENDKKNTKENVVQIEKGNNVTGSLIQEDNENKNINK